MLVSSTSLLQPESHPGNGAGSMPNHIDAKLLALSDLSERDRIQILLSEYAAMRAEIVARTGYGFQIAAVALVGITWLLQQEFSGRPWWFWAAMTGVAACFGIAIFVNTRDLTRVAHRHDSTEVS
jgi:hypothetical protein